MIVDTSAIMALLLFEEDSGAIVHALDTAETTWLSAGGWVELSAVLTRSKRTALFPVLDKLIAQFGIRVAPTTERQAQIAFAAYRQFGIGSGHPARLNFGDCFAYALATDRGEPLLFKGDDFTHTDVVAALA